ncbi:hypothetical protein TIFTF001_055416 [Ficus carica]|uniref:Uncharacterized protein n=1 Tax=Ficus carica TaxID=3494 RepID=A0AA88JIY2_FICCA|nr:hypothetical protein TIFTF001_055416 [Ficus carica]
MARNLMEIVLSHNGLTGAITLAHWEGLMKLVAVDLWNNSFSGSIPSSLFALPSLEEIRLSHNGLDGQLPEFTNPSSSLLAVLELSSNNLEGPIPVSIFELRKLIVLSLSFNKLNSTVQPDMIQGLSRLLTLDLSYSNLSFNAWGASFPKNIITLNLASCKLTKFPNLKNLSNVKKLDLSDNQIYGLVPNWIWEVGNESLFYLNLSVNYLVGIQEPYIIPSSLNTIDLHFNQIRGKIPIPPPFASYIDFSSNNSNSSISADIGDNLLLTIFLSFSDNGLTGIIPKSMCSAGSIYVLDLSDNSLSGRVPSCLFEW